MVRWLGGAALAVLVVSCGSSSLDGSCGDAACPDTGVRAEAAIGAGGSGGGGGVPGSDASVALGGDGGPTSAVAFWCASACRNSATLMCPDAATCAATCEKDYADSVASAPQCRPQLDTLLSCTATRLPQDWHCGTDGRLELRVGACEPEGSAAIGCLLGGGGSPDAGAGSWITAGCEAVCRKGAPLNCPRAGTCASDCQSDLEGIIAGKPQCMAPFQAFFSCLLATPLQSWMCSPDGQLQVKDGVCTAEAQVAANCLFGP